MTSISPDAFEPMSVSVAPSQSTEVFLSRQSDLAPWGSATRDVLSRLDPEIVQALLAGYQQADEHLRQDVHDAMLFREFAAEGNIGQNLDQEWFAVAKGRETNNTAFQAGDDWNAPEI